jgi:hypothetical protein
MSSQLGKINSSWERINSIWKRIIPSGNGQAGMGYALLHGLLVVDVNNLCSHRPHRLWAGMG